MSFKKIILFILVLILTLFSTYGCVKYHTRLFIEESSPKIVNGFKISTFVWAFVNSHSVDMYKPSKFTFYVLINPLDSSKAISHKNKIDPLFNIDSCFVKLYTVDEEFVLKKSLEKYSYNKYYKGKVYSFEPYLVIPNEVDTILMTLPYYSKDSLGNKMVQPPIEIKLIRHQSNSIFLPLD